jgi:hypothetical protein
MFYFVSEIIMLMSTVEQKQLQMNCGKYLQSQNLTFYFPDLINLFKAYLMLLSLTRTIWHELLVNKVKLSL